jgi:hypothetical protein
LVDKQSKLRKRSCFSEPDGQDDISHHGIVWKSPIVDGDWRSRKSLPNWKKTRVQIVQDVGVSDHRLLLKIAHESKKQTFHSNEVYLMILT